MTHLQVDAEYFVSTNIDVADGLFNGASGALKLIEYGTTRNRVRTPKRAWVDFRNPLTGLSKKALWKNYQTRKKIDTRLVPIERITRNLSHAEKNKGLEIVRSQIPLVAANGMTIMKAQGSSLPFVVVCVKRSRNREGKLLPRLSRELLYVACSRCTSLQGLFIDGEFEPPRCPGTNDPVTKEMERLRKNPLEMTLKFLQDIADDMIKIYFHNIQSFIAHQNDLTADPCANSR